ncbi:MAG: DUF4184 family protein [Candidatus Lokiarchaeota archaeon]|nr:DUF4184 family protein [Candidatus Lokiarchaeota archaeon]
MPVPPLHYPFSFGISKLWRFSLPGLIVGSVIPDIECLFLWIFFPSLPDHLFLHSFIGGLTVGTGLAILVTHFIYAPLMPRIFNIDKRQMNETCKINRMLVFSCMFGVLSHLILDFPMHQYNPHLWPFVDPFLLVGPCVSIVALLGFNLEAAYIVTNLIFHFVFLIIFLGIFLYYRRNPDRWSIMWLGDALDVVSSKENDSPSF